MKALKFGEPVSDEVQPPRHFEKAWLPLPGSTPVPLADLARNECKWPIGEHPTLFCGLESLTGPVLPDAREDERQAATADGRVTWQV